jgi:hypothetical protein
MIQTVKMSRPNLIPVILLVFVAFLICDFNGGSVNAGELHGSERAIEGDFSYVY